MKKTFSQFGNSLKKEELKAIKGGIWCEIYYQGMVFSGACSGSTVQQCNTYAQGNCAALMYGNGSGSCSHACW